MNYYKKMIALRASSETLKYGKFAPAYAKADVIAYTRTLGDEQYTTILNFSGKPSYADFDGEVAASNINRETYDGELAPWEAVVLFSY